MPESTGQLYNFRNFDTTDREISKYETPLLEDILEYDASNKDYGENEIYDGWNNAEEHWSTRLQEVTDDNITMFLRDRDIDPESADAQSVFDVVKEARNQGILYTHSDGTEHSLEEIIKSEKSPEAYNFILDLFFKHDAEDGEGYFKDWSNKNLTWDYIFSKTSDSGSDIKTFVRKYSLSDEAKTALEAMIENLKSENPPYDAEIYEQDKNLELPN